MFKNLISPFNYVPVVIGLLLFSGLNASAQQARLLPGVKFRAEILSLADEIERKTNRRIYAHFVEFTGEDVSMLGASYLDSDRTPVVSVNENLKNQPQKIEAVVTHELLHLRLRANGYPVFLWHASVKTRRGLAQDVEQGNVNDLTSLIEHWHFKTEMEKFGLDKIIDLAGDTERSARARRGESDGQADAINFARAVLEYPNPADIETLRGVYRRNNWQRSLKTGQEIADLIKRSKLSTPADSATVFRLCASKLYPTARPMKLTKDPNVTAYSQMLISY